MLEQALLLEFSRLVVSKERKLVICGMTLLLTRSQYAKSEAFIRIWPKIMVGIVQLLNTETNAVMTVSLQKEDDLDELEEKGYQASFAKLATVGSISKIETKIPVNIVEYVGVNVSRFMHENQQIAGILMSGISEDVTKYMQSNLLK